MYLGWPRECGKLVTLHVQCLEMGVPKAVFL